MLAFLQTLSSQHRQTPEGEKTGLPKKFSRKEQQAKKEAKITEKKRKSKPQTEKWTGGEPCKGYDTQRHRQDEFEGDRSFVKRRMLLHSLGEHSAFSLTTRYETTPPQLATTEPTRKSTRTRQFRLTTALGNPIPIKAIDSSRIFSKFF